MSDETEIRIRPNLQRGVAFLEGHWSGLYPALSDTKADAIDWHLQMRGGEDYRLCRLRLAGREGWGMVAIRPAEVHVAAMGGGWWRTKLDGEVDDMLALLREGARPERREVQS